MTSECPSSKDQCLRIRSNVDRALDIGHWAFFGHCVIGHWSFTIDYEFGPFSKWHILWPRITAELQSPDIRSNRPSIVRLDGRRIRIHDPVPLGYDIEK